MNNIQVLKPYLHHGVWVFDDADKELDKEPFVGTTNDIISAMCSAAGIDDAEQGFRLLFAATPFPDAQLHLVHVEGDQFGNTYGVAENTNVRGWLCPALLKYFEEPPAEIFAKAERL